MDEVLQYLLWSRKQGRFGKDPEEKTSSTHDNGDDLYNGLLIFFHVMSDQLFCYDVCRRTGYHPTLILIAAHDRPAIWYANSRQPRIFREIVHHYNHTHLWDLYRL